MSSEPYYADDLVTLYHGDCLEHLDERWCEVAARRLSQDVLPIYALGDPS